MARNTMDFAQQNTGRAAQATDWMRALAEQNLKQSKAAFEDLLTIARNAIRGVDQQAAFIRGSMTFSEKALSNTFDFAHKLVRMKEPQEFAQIQTEFVSRQAQLLEDQTKELGQIMRERMSQRRPHWRKRQNHPDDVPRPHEAMRAPTGLGPNACSRSG